MREDLARYAGGFVNLCAETMAGLASRAADGYVARSGLVYLSSSQAATAFENVYRQLDEEGALVYFSRKGASAGLVNAIAAAILELRAHGVAGAAIDSGSFVSPEKGQDIRMLLNAYERYLLERNYLDPPGLLALAIEQPADPGEAIYVIPPFLQLTPLETEFINRRIPPERLFVLQSEPIPGLSPPPGTPAGLWPARLVDCKDDEGSAGATGLMSPRRLPPEISPARVDYFTWRQGDITLFHAYGVTNEAREVLRRIIAMKIPLDTVTVAYTGPEYVQVFHALARRIGFEISAADGMTAALTRPGKALKGIIEWIRSDFATSVIRQLLIEGSISLRPDRGDRDLPPLAAAELLRDAGIGWGRERYQLLEAWAHKMSAELAADACPQGGRDESDQRHTYLLKRMQLAKQLFELMEGILAPVPQPDAAGSVGCAEFAAAMAAVLTRVARVGDELDALALDALLRQLGEIGRIASFGLGFEETLDRLAGIADELRVGASSPRPGALHLVGYRGLAWTTRSHTFMVGLEANAFPGGVAQDPVLLDSERQLLHPVLPLGRDRPGARQYELLTALCSRPALDNSRLILSYPSFDVVENRENLPSSLLLQAFRLLKEDPALDYSNLMYFLGSPAGYCPLDSGQALDETEWWLESVLAGQLANGPALVRQCYRSVDGGQITLSARQAGVPTEYDGMVAAAGGEFDLRSNHPVLSCSRIEYLAGCPFAYFLKYILKIYPPEDVCYDPGRWLDPLERGLLLHELYYNFMKQMAASGERVSVAGHRKMIHEMAAGLIESYRIATPPPGDLVFRRESREIYDSCEVFLATEETGTASTPVFFEVPFGLPEELPDPDMGATDPVRIDLGERVSFLLRGKIDRIDRMEPGVYCIWDYKTGSARGYEDHRYLCGGRQVQHALYAMAAEQILRDRSGGEPRVKLSGYYFPTRRGEGRRVPRQQSDRSKIAGLMGHLFGILAGGMFLATDDGEACAYCDYGEVCDRERAVPRARALVSDALNSGLEPWRRLKDFE